MNTKVCVRSRRGFTMIELLMVVVVVIVIAGFLFVMMTRQRVVHHGTRDSTQVRGIHQGLLMAAQSGQDTYPLPSLLDKSNATVAAEGRAKDTTSNTMSFLIFNGFFGPELCISSAESNPSIKQASNYSYSNPATAVDPTQALWDPSFSADFTNGKTSNFSYAHLLPAGPRRGQWRNTWSATEALVGNRGPQVASVTRTAESPATSIATLLNPSSNTLLIHGPKESWEGCVVYNDNHVEYETSMMPPKLLYTVPSQRLQFQDCLFYDEPEDDVGLNAFLGVYTTAGENPADWTMIWD